MCVAVRRSPCLCRSHPFPHNSEHPRTGANDGLNRTQLAHKLAHLRISDGEMFAANVATTRLVLGHKPRADDAVPTAQRSCSESPAAVQTGRWPHR